MSSVSTLRSVKKSGMWLVRRARARGIDGDQRVEEGLTGASARSSGRRRRIPTPVKDSRRERTRERERGEGNGRGVRCGGSEGVG